MKKVCSLLLIFLMVANPVYAVKDLFIIGGDTETPLKGLYRNPSADKLPNGAHSKFDDAYINDGNIQLMRGRDRQGTSAMADTTVNGFYYYETPAITGDSGNADLLVHFNGTNGQTTFTDESGTHTLTAVADAQVSTSSPPLGTGYLELDGTGDFVTIPDHADWFFSTNDFTVDFRWHTDNNAAVGPMIQHNEDATHFWQLEHVGGTNTVRFINQHGTISIDVTWNALIIDDTWYHFELVRSGSDFFLFQDGVSLTVNAGSASDASSVSDLTGLLRIGTDKDNAVLNGGIDELRIENGTARHTANFTPPNIEYGADVAATQHLVVAESDEMVVYDVDGTNRTQIISGLSDAEWDFTQVANALYMTSATDGQYKWFGDSTVTGTLVAAAPNFGYISEYKGVLMAAQGRNLRYSNAIGADNTDEETWTSSNHILVGDQQFAATGLQKARNSLIVFTAGSIQELTGFGSTFELRNLATNIGCVSNETIAADTNGDLIFFAGVLGVYKLQVGGQLTDTSASVEIDRTDTTFTHISAPMLNDVFRGDDSQISLTISDYTSAHAYYDLERNLYFLYVGQECFIYDNVNKAWSHTPATQMIASAYVYGIEQTDPESWLIDNVGFFWKNFTGWETHGSSDTITGTSTGATATTLTDSAATFTTANAGLDGVWVYLDNENGEWRQITSNTATQITVSSAWTTNPDSDTYYIGYLHPNFQTKQYSLSPPKRMQTGKFYLLHNKADTSNTLNIYMYDDKDATDIVNAPAIDLSTNFVDVNTIPDLGYWLEWEFEAFISDTDNTSNPAIDILGYAFKANTIKEK